MINRIKNIQGVTLVELLASLLIVSLVAAVAYQVLFQGYSNYMRIKIETEMRDEADLILTSLTRDIFLLKSSEIQVKPPCLPGQSKDSLIEITKKNHETNTIIENYETGFINNKVIVKGKHIQFYEEDIALVENVCGSSLNSIYNSITKGKFSNEYSIKFTLMRNNREMEFVNTVKVIDDEKENHEIETTP
jgi:prepilin-type N-terminal cleavage/methylation domain-containing protein